MATKKFSRQMQAVQNLAYPPEDWYEVTLYSVEEWENGYVFVASEYRNRLHPSVSYSAGHKVGPRGGVTTLYDHLNT
jgi:hypothetical protein